jgi:hypothetical protein
MKLRRILFAGALAVAFSPVFGLAQSQEPTVCLTDCRFEYDRAVAACGSGAASADCVNSAAAAYKTCLAACTAR